MTHARPQSASQIDVKTLEERCRIGLRSVRAAPFLRGRPLDQRKHRFDECFTVFVHRRLQIIFYSVRKFGDADSQLLGFLFEIRFSISQDHATEARDRSQVLLDNQRPQTSELVGAHALRLANLSRSLTRGLFMSRLASPAESEVRWGFQARHQVCEHRGRTSGVAELEGPAAG